MRTKILLWAAVLLVSCAPSLEEAQEEEQTVLLEFISPEGTKSVFSEGEMYRAPAVTVYAVGKDGFWKKDIFTSGGKNKMRLPPGQSYTFFALANLGDDALPTDRNGKLHPEQFVYLIPDRIGTLSLQGIPMAAEASADIPARGGELRVSIALQRLLAKVVVKIDKAGITSGADEPVVDSGTLCIRQANRRLMPFSADGSRALSPDDIFSGPLRAFDWYDFSSDGSSLTHTDIVLYVPENRQGVLLDQGLEEAKTWDELPGGKAALCTYIEYEGSKDGTRDGVSGPVTYRAYLGNDTTDDFSVNRNTVYNATLSLTWDGLMWQADGWRIDTDDLTDSRKLRFLDAEGNETSYLKIHRNGTGEFYAYFSINEDDGTTGRKDHDEYPYGWNLLFDGSTLSGHDGTPYDVATGLSVECLGEAVVSGKNALRLRVNASRSAALTTASTALRHRLSLRTTDGKIQAPTLFLDVEELPLSFEWVNGRPDHVGQRGILRCIDPYTGKPSADAVFHLKSGQSALSPFTDNGDGTITVRLTGAFSPLADAITLTDAEGERRCDIPLEARLPWFGCTDLETTYVDASSYLTFTYYACNPDGTRSSTPMQVREADAPDFTGNGTQLDKDIVLASIPPVVSGSAGRLGYERLLADDGTIVLDTYISSYRGLVPSGTSFKVDDAVISMGGAGSRGSHRSSFTAWNPWKDQKAVQIGEVLDDNTLYKMPKDNNASGWMDNAPRPSWVPATLPEYTMNIANPIVADEGSISFDARFRYGYDKLEEGYIGSICSGTPHKLSPDYASDKCTLEMRLVGSSIPRDMETYKRIEAYLHARGVHSFNATKEYGREEFDYTITVSSNYATRIAALADVLRPSVPGVTFSAMVNSRLKEWTMTYSMRGKTDENMNRTHSAGPVDLYLQVKNPHDGSYLRNKVGEIYMRLHAFIYPQCFVETVGGEGRFPVTVKFQHGNCPYLEVNADGIGNILRGHTFELTGGYTATPDATGQQHMYGPSASAEPWSPFLFSEEHMSVLCIPSDVNRTRAVRYTKSLLVNPYGNQEPFTNMNYCPFVFSNSPKATQGTWFRKNDYTFYFDPAGNDYGPFYNPKVKKDLGDQKLFVVHIVAKWYWEE